MAWKSSWRDERLADLVDDAELGGPRVGLREQSLGLVEQAGVVQRHAHAGRHRGEEPLVAVVERVRLEALEREQAEDPIAR